MNSYILILAALGALFLLGNLVFVARFGPPAFRFFRDDADFRAYVKDQLAPIRRHAPTRKELLVMLLIWAIGFWLTT